MICYKRYKITHVIYLYRIFHKLNRGLLCEIINNIVRADCEFFNDVVRVNCIQSTDYIQFFLKKY